VKKNIEDGKSFKLFDTKKGFGKLQLMSLLVLMNFGVQL
jgi:hypothetical protein